MEKQKQRQAVLELGRELIKELDSRDITAKWMSAYLSELIISSKSDPKLEGECRDLILSLWRERRNFPGGDPLERYSRALAAIELLLGTGEPVFQVCMPHNKCDDTEEDKISIARRLKHYMSCLVSALAKEAIKEQRLDEDELLDIAHQADPDDQTRLLSVLRIVICDPTKGSETDRESDAVRETIDELRAAIDDFETACFAK